jgi:superfamily II DNA/RNA helicase
VEYIAKVTPYNSIDFDKHSAVQQKAIIPIIPEHEVIVQSQSGTGKTGVFCLGTLKESKLASLHPSTSFTTRP